MRAERRQGESGISMIEVIVGTFLVTLIFAGVWFTYEGNRKIWDWGAAKVSLQQACTFATEAIARDVRSGASVVFTSSTDITIKDRVGTTIRRYYRDSGTQKLLTATSAPVVPEQCTALTFMPVPPDSEEVRFTITLMDKAFNSATVRGSAHLRNRGNN